MPRACLALLLTLVLGPAAATPAENVTLPDINTDEGLLARLFIAESRNPGQASYDADEVAKGMRAMKAVVDNRLKNNPGQFGAPGATTYVDIVGAAGQFHGFSKDAGGHIVIATDVQARIDKVLSVANTGAPGKYAAFVTKCNEVAKAAVDDPFQGLTAIGTTPVLGGGFGWRTAGSSAPGGSFVAIPAAQGGVIAGNQFYTIKKP